MDHDDQTHFMKVRSVPISPELTDVADHNASIVEQRAQEWVSRKNISARTALVTILGDTVAPLGGTVWLSDLITMAAPFGFNERLVRTSMFRLVAERWVQNERIGRRSQYSLTSFGHEEFANAEARIYRHEEPAWDEAWTLVFVPNLSEADHEFTQHLRWRGFAELRRGVYVAPKNDVTGVGLLVEQLDVEPPAVASARFADIAPLANWAPFQDRFGLAESELAYQGFVDENQWATSLATTALSDRDAFVVRTMTMHDWRRARLRDPELPRALLPDQWAGDAAMQMAAATYRATSDAAWRFAESVTSLKLDPTEPLGQARFGSSAPQRKDPAR